MKSVLAAGLAALLVTAGSVSAAVVSTFSPFTGDPAEFQVTIENNGTGVDISLAVDPSSTGNVADMQSFWFSISGYDSLGTYSATGADVTNFVNDPFGTTNLGGGSNINGGGSPGAQNFVVVFGSPGIGSDDIQSTSFFFELLGGTVSEDDFVGQSGAIRATSVGPADGSRSGSTKTTGLFSEEPTDPGGEVPLPASGFLILGGLGALAVIRRRKSKN